MEDPKIDKKTSSKTPKHGDRIVGFDARYGGGGIKEGREED